MKLDTIESTIRRRRERTARRLELFQRKLRLALSGNEGALIGDHTCIYAVGSGGRGEIAPNSDLDLFVVRVGKAPSRVDAALLQAAIVQASRAARFPDPSGDGEWLKLHTAESFVELLGRPDDDSENTFTARMLLLLESRVVLGDIAYARIVDKVIGAYWNDASTHPRDYQPILLLNDIVRYWRILLLNYEARIRQQPGNVSPAAREAKRRLGSYKLGFSRCLTCYSAVAYLLALTAGMNPPHVRRRDVYTMVRLTPLERLSFVRREAADIPDVPDFVDRLRAGYLGFLDTSDQGKTRLEQLFRQKTFRAHRSLEKQAFGDAMFELVSRLGQHGRLFRWIVI